MEIGILNTVEWGKAVELISTALKIGMDLNGDSNIGINKNTGDVYLWLEDYNFVLYVGLGSADVWVSYETQKTDYGFPLETKNLHDICNYINNKIGEVAE